MADFLREMHESSMRRAAAARAITPEAEIRRAAESMPPARPLRFSAGVSAGECAVIAEVKRAAPSAGDLDLAANVATRAAAYQQAGAAAISVLTEPSHFKGSLADLRAAREAVSVPVMRKDFIADGYQLYEARAAGADGVLLIAPMLSDRALRHFLRVCEYLGLFALVECFDEADLARAQATNASLIGLNCRNLRDLSIDFARFERLRGHIQSGRVAIAESGINTPAEFARVRELGYDAALIGSALMRDPDPARTLRTLTGAAS